MTVNQLRTLGIVLNRVEYGEADRIITVLTPDAGKLALMAKGVRRVKSKLAGGIELFSVSEITYIKGRGSVSTLVSARLQTHYGTIVLDIERTMAGYELIKILHKVTEDEVEATYFELLKQAFIALDDPRISIGLIQAWFSARLLSLAGHMPNLTTDTSGDKLVPTRHYDFNFEHVALERTQSDEAIFDTNTIKFCRLLFSSNSPQVIHKVTGCDAYVSKLLPLIVSLRQFYLSA